MFSEAPNGASPGPAGEIPEYGISGGRTWDPIWVLGRKWDKVFHWTRAAPKGRPDTAYAGKTVVALSRLDSPE